MWKFGDDINTDLIIPGRYLDDYDPLHLAKHAMEGASKEFASKVSKGDVIIAGRNFGCGSSREQAVIALLHSGVSAIVAESFARIFYRNAVNLGLPVLVSKDASKVFDDGERVKVDAFAGVVISVAGSKRATVERMPERVREILEAGGLVPHIKRTLSLGKGK